jgi:hypothetical protein
MPEDARAVGGRSPQGTPAPTSGLADARLGQGTNAEAEQSPVATVLRLTAITLLLRPMGPWFVLPFVLAAAALVLIYPRLLHTPVIWLGVGVAIALRIADDWPLADNHIYLLAYWLLAIALALRTRDVRPALASTSRWLIGLAFVFAVIWKAFLSPDFLDGRFFRVTLLTDPRFGEAAMLVGGLTARELEADRTALNALPHGAELLNAPAVIEPFRLRVIARASTWGILALETGVAVLMLLPPTRLISMLRHAALLIFCGITYAFAPVAGFGWLLLVMGLAQTTAQQQWLQRFYVATFLVVLFYTEIPWASLLLGLTR